MRVVVSDSNEKSEPAQESPGAALAKDERYRGPAHASPYGLSTLSPSYSLVDVAGEIEKADEMLGAVTNGKLVQIADQIRALQAQAEEVLTQAKRDLDLHRARCSFPRKVGHRYHLYRDDHGPYWSMLSPEDWGEPPHEFLGTFRLMFDQSWERESD